MQVFGLAAKRNLERKKVEQQRKFAIKLIENQLLSLVKDCLSDI